MNRKEFHDLKSVEEAKEIYYSKFNKIIKNVKVSIDNLSGRILSYDFFARNNVPSFDRSSKDGYAVFASDTFYANEEEPKKIILNKEKIPAGFIPTQEVKPGYTSEISTGAMIPRGANAVVMVEYTDENVIKNNPNNNIETVDSKFNNVHNSSSNNNKTDANLINNYNCKNIVNGNNEEFIDVYRAVSPNENIMSAGSDIMLGELLIQANTILGPKELAVLASQGISEIEVNVKPQVAIISTGDEIIDSENELTPGKLYDINSRMLIEVCNELNCESDFKGIINDDYMEIKNIILDSLESDVIILSGGTSAGTGDLCYRIIEELGEIIVHGVAIKPGKPVVLGVINGKPVIILPGFPTSAIITFNVFVKDMLLKMSGLNKSEIQNKIIAKTPIRINSVLGKHELVLINLVKDENEDYKIYPISKSSGSITTYAHSDGYVEIPANQEFLKSNELVEVSLLEKNPKIADLNFIGSHCVILENAIVNLRKKGFFTKVMHVGSSSGIDACKRAESDISGIHLLDEKTNEYNIPFLKKEDDIVLIRGYLREQGVLFREGGYKNLNDFILNKNLKMINRNKGSGTRVLLDMLLKEIVNESEFVNIQGYDIESTTHSSVAAAIATKRSDYGVAIKTVARDYMLNFIPLKDENYDFCIPKKKLKKKGVQEFIKILKSNQFKEYLKNVEGVKVPKNMGEIIWGI